MMLSSAAVGVAVELDLMGFPPFLLVEKLFVPFKIGGLFMQM